MRSRRVPSLLQACSCLSACLLLPVQAASCPPPPHEVGVCHRLCPVLFPDFVCLFGFARLLVSAPSRLQACSCPPALTRPGRLLPAQARSYPPAPHEVGVCHRLCPVSFPDFVCLSEAVRALPVSFRGRGRGRGRTPAHQHKYNAGAGFPTPALPDKRAQRHSMQDTQPETSVPSSAIWRSRM